MPSARCEADMLSLLWLVPTLPLLGFLVLAVTTGRLPRRGIAWIGAGSVGLSALVALLIGLSFLRAPPPGHAYTQVLWRWIETGQFTSSIALYLDPLSLLMTLVVTGVGFLIHLYSTEYMAQEEGYNRYFCYMNLFVAAMLVLVLAGDLLFLFLGWEGVGLCSYLLIGFWYRDAANGAAAIKAFIVTRVGDAAMIVGLFLLFTQLGTLDIQAMLGDATAQWPIGSEFAVAAAALLLAGALGKSAQLPLQTWLPDAMAGPTPVSALIHAATMVTAGVYLIARLHPLYQLAPDVQLAVAVIGALTLLLAGFSALVQHDIKRVLAYSTISQIGYMFLALGVGAWQAAMFHFMTHACFKALLFLAAGVVIHAMHGEQNMFRMGGLRRQLPLAFWTFLIGAASLSALPLVTAGFYSKDAILWASWASLWGSAWLWAAGWVGALVTALYTFRLVFHVFFGAERETAHEHAGLPVKIPLVVLAVLALVAGFVETPRLLGHITLFADFLRPVLAPARLLASESTELTLQLAAVVAALAGIAAAYLLFLRRDALVRAWADSALGRALANWWRADWGFDWLYDRLFVRPYVMLAQINRRDFIDRFYDALADMSRAAHGALSDTETGQL